ncbi:hypothetical protein [Endozoicomonas sp. ONNA1]|uniref:hypothetical protein n=1 Tax=Endozoicomonas sp. ONNA1 TaxID=2828740 RepID=UPI0021484F00|nr:hypothetical protein [Endozoicomonas sp. ONNA1]
MATLDEARTAVLTAIDTLLSAPIDSSEDAILLAKSIETLTKSINAEGSISLGDAIASFIEKTNDNIVSANTRWNPGFAISFGTNANYASVHYSSVSNVVDLSFYGNASAFVFKDNLGNVMYTLAKDGFKATHGNLGTTPVVETQQKGIKVAQSIQFDDKAEISWNADMEGLEFKLL